METYNNVFCVVQDVYFQEYYGQSYIVPYIHSASSVQSSVLLVFCYVNDANCVAYINCFENNIMFRVYLYLCVD